MSIKVSGGTGDVTKGFRTKGNITKLAVRAGAPAPPSPPPAVLGMYAEGIIPGFGNVSVQINTFTNNLMLAPATRWNPNRKCWETQITLSTNPENFSGGKSLKYVTKQRSVWDGTTIYGASGGSGGISGGGKALIFGKGAPESPWNYTRSSVSNLLTQEEAKEKSLVLPVGTYGQFGEVIPWKDYTDEYAPGEIETGAGITSTPFRIRSDDNAGWPGFAKANSTAEPLGRRAAALEKIPAPMLGVRSSPVSDLNTLGTVRTSSELRREHAEYSEASLKPISMLYPAAGGGFGVFTLDTSRPPPVPLNFMRPPGTAPVFFTLSVMPLSIGPRTQFPQRRCVDRS